MAEGLGVMAVLGWVPGHRATCRKPLALFWRLACCFFFFWWANQIFLLKDLRKGFWDPSCWWGQWCWWWAPIWKLT